MAVREVTLGFPEEGFDVIASASGRVIPSEKRPCMASSANGHMLGKGREEGREVEREEGGMEGGMEGRREGEREGGREGERK